MENKQPESVTLELNPEQFNTIVAGLQELPHKHSARVIEAIMQQVNAQIILNPEDK